MTTTTNPPTGRSSYRPGKARVGEPTPQSSPEVFSNEDIVAEARHLIRLNRVHGSNPLRTSAYLGLMRVLRDRGYEL